MTTNIEYALFSANVYGNKSENTAPDDPVRHSQNTLPVPDGWTVLEPKLVLPDGFMATAYQRGNEIVIAFAGTNETMWKDFAVGNIPAGAGLSSAQITQAMTFTRVRKIRAAANGAWRVSV